VTFPDPDESNRGAGASRTRSPSPDSGTAVAPGREASGEDVGDGLAVVDVEALVAGDFEASGVEAELMEDGGVDIGDVVTVLDGVEAEFVGRAMNHSPFDPGSR
jgi:hypothetical protein